MAGIRWPEKETIALHDVVVKEKERSKKVGVQINWNRIAKRLNAKFKNNRTPKACFWNYQRTRATYAKERKIPVRYPRPKNESNGYEKIVDAENYWITATDNEGNVIFSLLVKNTAFNVSKMLNESVTNLNEMKQESE